ncbi:thermonuclease family protein [Bartonella sp. HY761]|uniref:thermonuclease family protein n=1 Tax=Bartonella sp. HY761 TaxID=2979330 RepID=UPI0021FA94D2|nr:thermonuclease family protein [Bartonella sp. HY761]UXN07654.1 thermonuclease family protein [Bartonella sp. HY761]
MLHSRKKSFNLRSLMRGRKPSDFIIIFLIIICLALLKNFHNEQDTSITETANANVISGFAHISDGDSIRINGERIRLLGIDAPELAQYCTKGQEKYACGELSKQHLIKMINGRKVSCKWIERDKYKRILGQCMVENIDISRQMVEDGWAVSYSSYPKEERFAKNNKLGMWVWQVQRPNQWRKENPRKN